MRRLGLLIAVVPTLMAQTSPCDLNGDGVVNVADVQIAVNEALGLSACTMNLDGTGSCDIADVQRIIAAALGGTCQVTASASSNITLPIEVMGSAGTTNSASFNIPSSSASLLSGTQTLSLQIHGLKYETQASVQVNSSAWMPINSSTVTLHGLAGAYGGIGGGFHTLTMTMSLPAGTVITGNNTITFKFNGTDGVTSGYRVLALNVIGSDGSTQFIPSTTFVWDNPNNWQPPSTAASDIVAGQTLYTSASLTVPLTSGGTSSIQAHCGDCHTQDGRDLKYFNYSNNSIVARSVFHGLSTQQGNQIASYIRSLNLPNPGRPWNPPYQPGPGMDSLPVSSWAAGAGIGAVIASDAAMQPYVMPGGNSATWAANAYLNVREMPIPMQLPDWNAWLPTVHPMDSFNTAFNSSGLNSGYTTVRAALQANNQTAYANALYLFDQWFNNEQTLLLPIEGSANWNATLAAQVYSVAQWVMVKQWEINQDFGLEAIPQAAFGAKANVRGWYGGQAFNTSPIMLHIPLGPGLGNGTTADHEYIAFIWYQTQLILNDGQGGQTDHNPIDYGYTFGAIKDNSINSGNTPAAWIQTVWLLKALQEETLKGPGPQAGMYSGFEPPTPEIVTLVHGGWASDWTGTSTATQVAISTAYLQAWFAKMSSYTPANYYAGADGNGRPWASPSENPATDDPIGTFGGQIWYTLPRFRYLGVSPTLINQVSAWAATVFPGGNWAVNNAATCSSLDSCTSD
jgi:hypothetical protein